MWFRENFRMINTKEFETQNTPSFAKLVAENGRIFEFRKVNSEQEKKKNE